MADGSNYPEHGWTCFHCGEHFPPTETGVREARDHFGTDTEADPGCIMRLDGGDKAFLRILVDMQSEVSRYQEEDSDAMRQLAKKTGEHARQLVLAEETGFARGLTAGFNYWPEALALLIEDNTATPVTLGYEEEGDDGEPIRAERDPREVLAEARSVFAAAIRSLNIDEARDILQANRDAQKEAGSKQAKPEDNV